MPNCHTISPKSYEQLEFVVKSAVMYKFVKEGDNYAMYTVDRQFRLNCEVLSPLKYVCMKLWFELYSNAAVMSDMDLVNFKYISLQELGLNW